MVSLWLTRNMWYTGIVSWLASLRWRTFRFFYLESVFVAIERVSCKTSVLFVQKCAITVIKHFLMKTPGCCNSLPIHTARRCSDSSTVWTEFRRLLKTSGAFIPQKVSEDFCFPPPHKMDAFPENISSDCLQLRHILRRVFLHTYLCLQPFYATTSNSVFLWLTTV